MFIHRYAARDDHFKHYYITTHYAVKRYANAVKAKNGLIKVNTFICPPTPLSHTYLDTRARTHGVLDDAI